MKEQTRVINKKFFIYAFCYLFFMILFIWGGVELFDFSNAVEAAKEQQSMEFYSFLQIVMNNMKNFLGYVVLFPIYPILFLMDFISTGISIVLSISTQGLGKTLLLLAPHGIVEIPNFIFYSYLSGRLFYHFYKDKKVSLKEYWNRIVKNKKYYLICVVIIILAGALEGFLTPALYHMRNIS